MTMQKISYPCPCGGKLKWKKEEVVVESVSCGTHDIEYCGSCGEEYFPEETMQSVQRKLKEAGLWGIERKEARLWKSGNSVLLRIPKGIADELSLHADEKVILYAEGKNKLIVEV